MLEIRTSYILLGYTIYYPLFHIIPIMAELKLSSQAKALGGL
jgi:hypothetical protein